MFAKARVSRASATGDCVSRTGVTAATRRGDKATSAKGRFAGRDAHQGPRNVLRFGSARQAPPALNPASKSDCRVTPWLEIGSTSASPAAPRTAWVHMCRWRSLEHSRRELSVDLWPPRLTARACMQGRTSLYTAVAHRPAHVCTQVPYEPLHRRHFFPQDSLRNILVFNSR